MNYQNNNIKEFPNIKKGLLHCYMVKEYNQFVRITLNNQLSK